MKLFVPEYAIMRRGEIVRLMAVAMLRHALIIYRNVPTPQNLEDSRPLPLESDPARLLTVSGS